MAAVRINLLPHREQKRQARQRQFISLALSLVVLGLAIVALVVLFPGGIVGFLRFRLGRRAG